MNRFTIVLAGTCLAALGLAGGQAAAQPAPLKQGAGFVVIPPPADGKPGRSLKVEVSHGPPCPVAGLAFSPDGKLLATGGYQEVLIWDLAGAKLQKQLGTGQIGDLVQALAWHKDGKLLAVAEGTARGAGSVQVYNVETGERVAAFAEPKDVTYALALSPDGKWLAAGGADSKLRIWNLDDKTCAATLEDHAGWIQSLAFSADGKFLVSASADRTSIVWEAGTWKRLYRLDEKEPVQAAAFSPDGQLVLNVLAGEDDKVLRLRKRENGELVREMNLGPYVPSDVSWFAPTNRIILPCTDEVIRVYDGGNGNQTLNLTGTGSWVLRAVVSPDGAKLATSGADGQVKLWAFADGRPLATLLQLTPRTPEWAIVTPAGYLGTSTPAAVHVYASELKTPNEQILERLQKPELLQQALRGEQVPAPDLP